MKRKDFMVFRGCVNTVPVNSITTTREEQKMEEEEKRKERTKANMPQWSKHSIFLLINSLSLSL